MACLLLLASWLAMLIAINAYPPLTGVSQPPGFRWVDRLALPMFLPLVAAAAVTATLCWQDRRPPKGHCQTCGYDLTGNVSGPCPECGQPA